VKTDWSRLGAAGLAIGKLIDALGRQFSFEQPANSINGLVDVLKAIRALPEESVWKTQKEKEVIQLITACMGLVAEATTESAYAVPGQNLTFQLLVNQRGGEPIRLNRLQYLSHQTPLKDTLLDQVLLINQNWQKQVSLPLPFSTQLSQPYWLEKPMKDKGTFDMSNDNNTGKAWSDPVLTVSFHFQYKNVAIPVSVPIQFKYVDPVKGELYQLLQVIEPFSVSLNKKLLLTGVGSLGKQQSKINKPVFELTAHIKSAPVPLQLMLLDSLGQRIWQKDTLMALEPGTVYPVLMAGLEQSRLGGLTHLYPAVQWFQENETRLYKNKLNTIQYDHIPHIYYAQSEPLLVNNDAIQTLAGRRVGFVEGAGDFMPDALAALGYPVTRIQEDNLTDEMLQDIDVLFVGIRAFNLFEWLTNKNEILNRFVAKGGHLVVQYLKSNQVGNKRVKVGPFPFAMSGVRVTEENAPVTFSQTEHPLVKYPNQLTATDFEHWVQERSTYQMEPVTSPYVGLLQMNDKNDKPTNGSWVTAPYGKGHITYVSLVLFRQLPVANTGAYRILANLVAWGASDKSGTKKK
jgi:hypothetical protein